MLAGKRAGQLGLVVRAMKKSKVEAEHLACWMAERQSTRGNTLAEQWIPRRHIGKGPGQPPQLACTGRLQGSATQVAWSRDRALEAREHTLAELWIPRRRIGKGTGQPPQLASTRRLRGSATQVAWSRDRALEAREHARRAVDPAETHWQGPRTAAAASLHKAAAGQRDSGRLESGQSTRGEGTRSQSSGSRGDALARAQDSRRS